MKLISINLFFFYVSIKQNTYILWFLFLIGLDTNNDKAILIQDDRIDPLLPIVMANRKNLKNIVILPKPPPTSEPPREFHYIEPNNSETKNDVNDDEVPSDEDTIDPVKELTETHNEQKISEQNIPYNPPTERQGLIFIMTGCCLDSFPLQLRMPSRINSL